MCLRKYFCLQWFSLSFLSSLSQQKSVHCRVVATKFYKTKIPSLVRVMYNNLGWIKWKNIYMIKTHCTTQYFLISCQPSILELSHICITKNTSSRSLSSLLNINKYRCVLNVALTKVQQIHYTHIRLLS